MSVSTSTATAKGPTKLALIAYATALIAIALDQISKFWVVHILHLPERERIFILPIFSLSMVGNEGVSYGFLKAHDAFGRWGLVLFSFAVAIAIAVWAWRTAKLLPALALGLIMGGALGNALDRARLGYVVDFLDFSGAHFPWVFNVADSAITVGALLLILDSFRNSKPD